MSKHRLPRHWQSDVLIFHTSNIHQKKFIYEKEKTTNKNQKTKNKK